MSSRLSEGNGPHPSFTLAPRKETPTAQTGFAKKMVPNYRLQDLGLAPTWEHNIFEVKGPWECKIKKDFCKELVVYCVFHSAPRVCYVSPGAQVTVAPGSHLRNLEDIVAVYGAQQAETGHLQATTGLVSLAAGSQSRWNRRAGPGGTTQLTARCRQGPQGPSPHSAL